MRVTLIIPSLLLAIAPFAEACSLPAGQVNVSTSPNPAQPYLLSNFTPDNATQAGSLFATNLHYSPVETYCLNYTMAQLTGAGTLLTIAQTTDFFVYEINPAGATVWSLSMSSVNSQLSQMGLQQLIDFNHDALRMPNGQTAVIGHTEELVSCSQYPYQCPTGPTVGNSVDVMGDSVVVVNQSGTVTWYWSAFTQFVYNGVNYLARPAILWDTCTPNSSGCPVKLAPVANDWTHANSLDYDPNDGNIVLNMRDQSWTLKLSYTNGTGDGHIVWRFGQYGDFNLAPNSDPWPWFSYAHDVTSPSPGLYTLFDNGNVRVFPAPVGEGSGNSRGQVYQIDETAMTATLIFNRDLGVFSPGAGSAQQLTNGNYSFLAGRPTISGAVRSRVFEFTPGGKLVFEETSATQRYRAMRLESLSFY